MVKKKKVLTQEILDKQVSQELEKSLSIFRKSLSFMAGDAPIEVLCLPKSVQTVLLKQGLLRVYDLFNRDLVKIKGIGKIRARNLATCLDQFLSISC